MASMSDIVRKEVGLRRYVSKISMGVSKPTNTVDLAIVMPERDTEPHSDFKEHTQR
jgi:hypothetical protein